MLRLISSTGPTLKQLEQAVMYCMYRLMRQNETVHKMNHPLCASISPCEQGWDDDMENARSDIIPEIV